MHLLLSQCHVGLEEALAEVMKAATQLRLPVIADEVYAGMSFSRPFVSCAEASAMVPVLSVCALSKRWLAPGRPLASVRENTWKGSVHMICMRRDVVRD